MVCLESLMLRTLLKGTTSASLHFCFPGLRICLGAGVESGRLCWSQLGVEMESTASNLPGGLASGVFTLPLYHLPVIRLWPCCC